MLSCDGDRHHTSNRRVYRLSAWGLEAGPDMGVTWHPPSNAETTKVVTTNKGERLKSLLRTSPSSPILPILPILPISPILPPQIGSNTIKAVRQTK
ncbi:hypothetical protein [Laspinema palackyanum]|uniref:hypothetical protein n=1 Tax=Laspinema palackyanum TaxID=3231601 RepID=UPI00349F203E